MRKPGVLWQYHMALKFLLILPLPPVFALACLRIFGRCFALPCVCVCLIETGLSAIDRLFADHEALCQKLVVCPIWQRASFSLCVRVWDFWLPGGGLMIGLSALHFYLIYTCCFEALLPIVEAPLFFAFNRTFVMWSHSTSSSESSGSACMAASCSSCSARAIAASSIATSGTARAGASMKTRSRSPVSIRARCRNGFSKF